MGRTTKPCPGCKSTIYHGRPADDVCPDCRAKLKFYDERELEEKGELKRDEVVSVEVAGAPCWLPYIPHARRDGTGFSNQPPALEHIFRTAFRELALGLSEPQVGHAPQKKTVALYTYANSDRPSVGEDRLMQPGVARCLREIYDTARDISENAYADGARYGMNLLERIRSGDISVNDAEAQVAALVQKTLKKNRRK